MYNWADNYTVNDFVEEPQIEYVACKRELLFPEVLSSTKIIHTTRYIKNYRIFSLLSEFEEMEYNWDGDEAKEPSKRSIEQARSITHTLSLIGQNIFHAVPGPNGEIMIDLRDNRTKNSLEIIFYPENTLYVKFPADGSPSQGEFSLYDLPALLDWLRL